MNQRRIPRPALAALLLAASVTAASAADVPLAGDRIKLVDGARPAARKNVVALLGAVDLAAIDPTVTGGTAIVGRPGGAVVAMPLPAGGWRAKGKGARRRFEFKSRTDPVRSARLVNGRSLRFTAHGPDAYPLGGTPQGEISVVLTIGDVRFCALFGGDVVRDDGTRFRARGADAPAACPAVAGSSTTTSTTATTTSTTTLDSTTTTTIAPTGCNAPAGARARPAGCACESSNDCCGTCGGNPQNRTCGGSAYGGSALSCFGPECQFPAGIRSRGAGCPCQSTSDCCAQCGGSAPNRTCGGSLGPNPPAVCLD